MKSFYELSEKQQKSAIEFAFKTLTQTIDLKVLDLKPELKEEWMELAIDVAEFGVYDDDGRPALEEDQKGVPFYFQGGCV